MALLRVLRPLARRLLTSIVHRVRRAVNKVRTGSTMTVNTSVASVGTQTVLTQANHGAAAIATHIWSLRVSPPEPPTIPLTEQEATRREDDLIREEQNMADAATYDDWQLQEILDIQARQVREDYVRGFLQGNFTSTSASTPSERSISPAPSGSS